MMKVFNLELINKPEFITPLNGNVLCYLEDEIASSVLLPFYKKSFVNWNYSIAISFNDVPWNESFIPPIRQIKSEKMKYTNMMIPISLLKQDPEYSEENIKLYIKAFFEGFILYCNTNFKKIAKNDLTNLYNALDFKKLSLLSKAEDKYPNKILKAGKL